MTAYFDLLLSFPFEQTHFSDAATFAHEQGTTTQNKIVNKSAVPGLTIVLDATWKALDT
jgi:hypothetical protein